MARPTGAVLALFALMLTASASAWKSSEKCMDPKKSSSVACHPAPDCPDLDHVIYVIMENTALDTLLNKTATPNIYSLTEKYSPALNYYGYTHDSEPNYVALVAGTNQCDHGDAFEIYNITSVFDQLLETDRTYKCYSQSLPVDGFNGFSYPTEKLYMQKHNPCALLKTSRKPENAHLNTNYETFIRDLYTDNLPLLSIVVPDQCHDMHGFDFPLCNSNDNLLKFGDDWTKTFFDMLTGTKTWEEKKVLVVFVYDENDYSTTEGCCSSPMNPTNAAPGDLEDGPSDTCKEKIYDGFTVSDKVYGGGKTLAMFAYSQAKSRCTLDYPMNHLSVLKTLQYCWKLPYLGYAGRDNVPFVDNCVFQ